MSTARYSNPTPPSPPGGWPYQPLVLVAAALAVGIVGDAVLDLAWWITLPLGAIALLCWSLALRAEREAAAGGLLLLAVATAGAADHQIHWSSYGGRHISRYARGIAQPVCLEAVAIDSARFAPPQPRDPLRGTPTHAQSRLLVEVKGVRDGVRWIAASGRVRCLVQGGPLEVRAGDRVRVYGSLRRVSVSLNPGQFNYANYLRAERLLCTLRTDHVQAIEVVAAGPFWNWRRQVDTLRQRGQSLLWSQISPERVPLVSAILLGNRGMMSAEETEPFLATGTIHLLSVSGVHVGILAAMFFFLLRRLGVSLRWTLPALFVSTGLYVLVADAEPPAVRALILIWVAAGALVVHRPVATANALALAAILVLLLNPCDLFRTGPQLSFLCMAALSWWYVRLAAWQAPRDPLNELIARTRPLPMRAFRGLGARFLEAAWISLLLTAVTAPLVLHQMHTLAPIAVVLGPLLLIPTAVAMWSGFLLLLVGPHLGPLTATLGTLCDSCFALLQTIVDWGAQARGGHSWQPGPAMWWVVGCYVLIAVAGLAPRELLSGRRKLTLLVAWLAVGFAAPLVREGISGEHAASVRCTTLAMGHGLGVVLEFPDGKTLLYDCGRLGSPSGAADSVASYLWWRGKTHVDAVVISHADADHFNGLPELLDRFSVGAVYVNPVMFDRQGAALRVLQNALTRHRLTPRELQAADRFVMGQNIRLEVLLPPPGGMLASSNANSVVILVEAHGRRLLLTGDLEKQGLELLLRERPVSCDLLLAPHHGSRGSEPARMIQWCEPRWTIVSGALNRRTDEALAAYRLAGTRPLLTALDGAIQYEIAADRATLRHWNAAAGWRNLEVQDAPVGLAP